MGALELAFSLIEKADPEKTLPQCGIKAIEIGPEALTSITAITQQFIPTQSTVAVVADKTIIQRQGLDAKRIIRELVSEFYIVQYVELDDGHSELHASEDVISATLAAIRETLVASRTCTRDRPRRDQRMAASMASSALRPWEAASSRVPSLSFWASSAVPWKTA